jgi:glucose-6-phosphate dehydrogenase assembly protein OpcA
MNLLCIAPASEAEAMRGIAEQLYRHAPCRAFLLLLDEQTNGNTAEVSAVTRRHGPMRDIVLEEVVLRVRSKDLSRMPGLLRPLILDDLPSHLFWSQAWPGDEQSFDTLAKLSRHAIVDSMQFGNPARELAIIKQRQDKGQCMTDLSWLRVQPWRRALAEAFDRIEWQPKSPVSGTVRHGKNARATSMLLSEWLHERLAATISMEPDGNKESVGPDHVSLRLSLPGGDIEIEVELQGGQLITHVTTQSHCYLPFRSAATRGTTAKLLSLAIDAS